MLAVMWRMLSVFKLQFKLLRLQSEQIIWWESEPCGWERFLLSQANTCAHQAISSSLTVAVPLRPPLPHFEAAS